MARTIRYVNTASTAGGDGTTNATAGANRAYASLEEAVQTEGADITGITPDDVTVKGYLFADVSFEIICDKAGGDDVPTDCDITLPGSFVYDSTHRLLIRAADNSWHDNLKIDTGYKLTKDRPEAYTFRVTSGGDGLYVAGIEIEESSGGGGARALIDTHSTATSTTAAGNVYYSCIFNGPDTVRVAAQVRFINCRLTAFTEATDLSGTTHNVRFISCLIDKADTGLDLNHSSAHYYNTAVINVTTGNDFNATPSNTGTNASQDTSAPGTGSVTGLAESDFTAFGTEDFRPTTAGLLHQAGHDMVTDGQMASRVDAAGNARPNGDTWAIGPLEPPPSAGGLSIPVAMNSYRQRHQLSMG